MKWRKTAIGLVLLLIVAMLSACGGNNIANNASNNVKETNTDTAGSTATGTVGESSSAPKSDAILNIFNYKVEIAQQLEAMAADYEKETGIKIKVETYGGGADYSAALKTKFSSGNAPDIFFVAGYSDLDLWQEYLEDLSDQPWVSDAIEATKAPMTKDGKLYGMPLGQEGYGFIYNKDLFAKAGITELPKTLSALTAAAEKLKSAGITPFENGYAEWWVIGNHLLNVGFGQQSDPSAFIEDLNSGKAKMADNAVLNNWANLLDLTVKYGQKNQIQTDYNTQVTEFASGKTAMMQQGVWTQSQIDQINPNIQVGFLPMPLDDSAAMNKLPVGVPNNWVVNKNSKVKEEAKAFLNWLVSSDTGKKYIVEQFKFIPAFKSIPATEEQLGPLAADIIKYSSEDKTIPWIWAKFPGYEANTAKMAATIQAYITGKIDRTKMFEDMQNDWNSFITQ